jgi:uncharacterized SAM-binding protein YcdF (DUF218 family)
LKVVFTGGGVAFPGAPSESEIARQAFQDFGLETEGMIFEGRSRNSRENALYSYEKVQPSSESRWLLVTSAMHMPRAVGLFRKAGWNVVPYPVDYKTPPQKKWRVNFGLRGGLSYWRQSAREWAFLANNCLYGHSDSFFPAP